MTHLIIQDSDLVLMYRNIGDLNERIFSERWLNSVDTFPQMLQLRSSFSF